MDTAEGAAEREASLREQLASFRPLLALSMVMTGSRDESEILSTATTAVPSVGGCRVEAVHVDDDWRSVGSVGRPAEAELLQAQLTALDRFGGAVTVQGAAWAWAYPLTSLDEIAGYLVVSGDSEPEAHHKFLLNVLAQQAGAALVNARLHARERASAARERAIADQLRAANLALEQAMAELAPAHCTSSPASLSPSRIATATSLPGLVLVGPTPTPSRLPRAGSRRAQREGRPRAREHRAHSGARAHAGHRRDRAAAAA
jgi:hypothetical protein